MAWVHRGVEQKRLIIPKGATDAQKAALRADAKRNSDDGVAMEEAAKAAKPVGAKWTASWEYYSTHTHADWTSRSGWRPPDGTVYSPPCEVDGTASEGPCVTCAPSSGGSEDEPDDGDVGGNQETPVLSYSLVSSDGIYTAEAGTGHEANFTSSSPYSSVSWYLKTPSDTSGVYQRTDSGDGSSTAAQFGYSFPSGVSGDYVFKAMGTIGTTGFEESYTVSVSLPTPSTPPATVPVWSNIPDPYNLSVGDSFSLDLNSYVTGSPTITKGFGDIPAGLSLSSGVLSGTVTGVESRSIRFIATNTAGTAKSEWVDINITDPQGNAPVWSDIPDPYNLTVGESFRVDFNSYVTGSPTLTKHSGGIVGGLSLSNGILSGSPNKAVSHSFRISATNAAGSAISEWITITVTAAQ